MFFRIKRYIKKLPLVKSFVRYRENKARKVERHNKLLKFLSAVPSPERERQYFEDIELANKQFGFSLEEYFWYELENKTEAERRAFVSDKERISYCESMNCAENQCIFDDKDKAYHTFGEFYGRELFAYKSESDYEQLVSFFKKHNQCIIKPNNMYCGIGIKKINVSTVKTPEELAYECMEEYAKGFVVEELIMQHELLAALHPQSVNTVRVPTIRFDDRVEVVHPCLRIGRGGACVDNAGAGGIIAALDKESGRVITARDEMGRTYDKHPETQHPIVGFQVPYWEEAVQIAKKLATVIPSNRYTGWDLALTERGWVVVEGNAKGQFIWQIATKEGFYDELQAILKELNISIVHKN